MQDLLHDWNGATVTPQPGGARRPCAMCGRHGGGTLYGVQESDLPPDDRQSWLLCADCARAVQREVERAALPTTLRVRIAIGIVSTQRRRQTRTHYPIWSEEYWENLDDPTINKLINRFIVGLFVFKTIVVIVVAAYVTRPH
jgi:hypothetical protein